MNKRGSSSNSSVVMGTISYSPTISQMWEDEDLQIAEIWSDGLLVSKITPRLWAVGTKGIEVPGETWRAGLAMLESYFGSPMRNHFNLRRLKWEKLEEHPERDFRNRSFKFVVICIKVGSRKSNVNLIHQHRCDDWQRNYKWIMNERTSRSSMKNKK
jgi:hypothetical protein